MECVKLRAYILLWLVVQDQYTLLPHQDSTDDMETWSVYVSARKVELDFVWYTCYN